VEADFVDSMTDVNTLLSNAEKVFTNQASLARTASKAALLGIDDPLVRRDRYAATRMQVESDRLATLAATWDARAAEARRGYLLFSKAEVEDTEFVFTYGDLIQTCRDAGRIVYTRPIDADLVVTTSPKPGGPIPDGDMPSLGKGYEAPTSLHKLPLKGPG
jgi:hypothetical protein